MQESTEIQWLVWHSQHCRAFTKTAVRQLSEVLVENGNVSKELAIEVGVLKKENQSTVAELEDVKVTIGETPCTSYRSRCNLC